MKPVQLMFRSQRNMNQRKAFTFDSGRENEPGRQNELLWQGFFLTEMVKLTWNAEKHKICWKACFVVTCLFFLMEMAKLTWNAEKHKICWKACFVMTCLFLMEMAKLTWNAEKHKTCWKACFVVTCLICFNGNCETYMKCWEAQNLLKNMFCCDMSIFLMEMAKLTWNAEKHKICWKACFVMTCLFLMEMAKLTWNAEKHKTCWKACFVVTCLICFNGNCETYMKCWEAQNLLKNMFCCDMSIFLMEMAKLTWNAEKQVMLRSKKYLLKSMFCCDMSNFFDGKNLNYWCLIGEHSRNTQTGTKRYGRFIFCIYLHDTMETFFGSFLLCW